MNTLKNNLKVAALGVAMVLNAKAADLTAKVPVDFKTSGVSASAGEYRISAQLPGMVVVKTAAGKNVAGAMLPVKTSNNPTDSTLTFSRLAGVYHLSGYCVAGSGCWSSTIPAQKMEEKTEIALMLPR
jgi:hypothetical protein